jgi:hypothetical protein
MRFMPHVKETIPRLEYANIKTRVVNSWINNYNSMSVRYIEGALKLWSQRG